MGHFDCCFVSALLSYAITRSVPSVRSASTTPTAELHASVYMTNVPSHVGSAKTGGDAREDFRCVNAFRIGSDHFIRPSVTAASLRGLVIAA